MVASRKKPSESSLPPKELNWICSFDDKKYDKWLSRIETKIDRILALVQSTSTAVSREGTQIMTIQDDVDSLVAAVQAETSVVASVQTLLTQLTTMINNLKGQVTDPAAVAALEQAVTQLQQNNQAISDAVTANTPAA